MNPGNINPIAGLQTALQRFNPNGQVTPEEYQRNATYIEQARQLLAHVEQRNDEGYRRFTAAERELRERIQAGRDAEQMLAQLEARRYASANPAPPLPANAAPVPGPSTHWQSVQHSNQVDGGAHIIEVHDTPPSSTHSRANSSNTSRGPAPVAPPSYGSATTPWYDNRASGRQAQRHTGHILPATQYPQHVAAQLQPTQQQYGRNAPMYMAPQQYTGQGRHARPGDTNQTQPQAHPGFTGFASVATPVDMGTKYDAPPPAPSAPLAQSSFVKPAQSAITHAPVPPLPTPGTEVSSRPSSTNVTFHSTPRTSSASAPPNAEQSSVARKAMIGNATRNVFDLMKPLSTKEASVVNRFVVNELRSKVEQGNSNIVVPSINGFESDVTEHLSNIGKKVADMLKDFGGEDIIFILRIVSNAIAKNAAASVSSPGPTSSHANVTATQSSEAAPPATAAFLRTGPGVHPTLLTTARENPQPATFPTPSAEQTSLSYPAARASSPITPAKADRRTLAKDIIRSLGRPSAEFLNSVPPSLFVGSDSEASVASIRGKRKRSTPPADASGRKQKAIKSVPSSSALPSDSAKSPLSEAASDSEVMNVLYAEEPSSEPASAPADAMVVEQITVDAEIKTPGATELELEQTRASNIIPSSPAAGSIAPLPPSSRVSTPADDHRQTNGEPMQVDEAQPVAQSSVQVDSSGNSASLLLPSDSGPFTSPSHSGDPSPRTPERVDGAKLALTDESSALATPVAGPSKTPLFFASDSPEPQDDSLSRADASLFIPSGLLGDRVPTPKDKGKQKAVYDDSSDIEVVEPASWKAPRRLKRNGRSSSPEIVESSEPDEAKEVLSRPPISKRRRLQPYILLKPPPRPPRSLPASQHRRTNKVAYDVIVIDDSDSPDEIAEDFDGGEREAERWRKAETVETYNLCLKRVNPQQCRWPDCKAVLMTGRLLQDHAEAHAVDHEENDPLICQWNNCSNMYATEDRLARHLRKHAMHPLNCPVAECDFACQDAPEMTTHLKHALHFTRLLKPSLRFPNARPEPPPLPKTLPSYMSVARDIRKHRILAQRHAILAPKVAAKITRYVPIWQSEKSRRARRTRRLTERLAAVGLPGDASGRITTGGRYDCWAEAGYTGPPLDGIPSTYVTGKVAERLVIDDAYLRRGGPEEPAQGEDIEVDVENDELGEFPEFVQGSARANNGAEEIENADAEERVTTEANAAPVEDVFAPNLPANDDIPAPPPPDALDFDEWLSPNGGSPP